jgi:hypothetical protein
MSIQAILDNKMPSTTSQIFALLPTVCPGLIFDINNLQVALTNAIKLGILIYKPPTTTEPEKYAINGNMSQQNPAIAKYYDRNLCLPCSFYKCVKNTL